ncbi:hypothetical protein P5V15_014971 [Pogonomyrmex californicus]
MYLARKSHGDGVSESRSDDDVIENERWFETIERQEPQPQSQSQLESQPEPQLEPQSQPQLQLLSQSQLLVTTTSSTSMRETDPMQQHSNARRLQDDDNDDDDDDKNEEEQPGDNVWPIFIPFSIYASSSNERVMIVYVCFQFSMTERRAPLRVILVGWDNFRTRLLLFLIACLFVWACVFFPLLAT